jgi:hypothetical protein
VEIHVQLTVLVQLVLLAVHLQELVAVILAQLVMVRKLQVLIHHVKHALQTVIVVLLLELENVIVHNVKLHLQMMEIIVQNAKLKWLDAMLVQLIVVQ